MIVGTVFSKVLGARFPEVTELVFRVSTTDPVKLHGHWFGFSGDDYLIGYTNSYGIVALHGHFGLWPAHFHEILTEGYHLFGTYEEA